MSGSTLDSSSTFRFWPEVPQNVGGTIGRKMVLYWGTYIAWCVARGIDCWTPLTSEQPTIGEINDTVRKAAEHDRRDVGESGYRLWNESVLSIPWEEEGSDQWGDLIFVGEEISEDDHPKRFADAYKSAFVVWVGYRILLSEQCWRCFHYGHRAGAGWSGHHPKRKYVYPGNPLWESAGY